MPCYDAGYEAQSRFDEQVRREKEWLHNSPVAELLCGVLSNLPASMIADAVRRDPKVGHWWNDHQERDRKKAAQEAARKKRDEQNRLRKISELEGELRKLKKG
jgi:hypothetical protein